MCTHNQCFEQKNKKNVIFHLKINIFTAMKYFCIFHGRVCVMHVILLKDTKRVLPGNRENILFLYTWQDILN